MAPGPLPAGSILRSERTFDRRGVDLTVSVPMMGGSGWANLKGIPMHKTLILLAGITFASAGAALAQDAAPSQQPATPPVTAPAIQSVNVIDVSELPQETQTQVDKIVQETSDESMQQLHSMIESTPEAKAALDAKGASANQVVATSMGADGTLTLITKKNS